MNKKESMVRTQVYLTRDQHQSIKSLAIATGMQQSELIRRGIDLVLADENTLQGQWKQSLADMEGIWKNDEDAELRMLEIRNEFNR